MTLKSYDPQADTVVFQCRICRTETEQNIGDQPVEYIEDFGQFNNINLYCPECEAVIVINLSIPEYEEMEIEGAVFMPPDEKVNRAVIREIMWDRRPDLRDLDRESEIVQYQERHAQEIERSRARAEEMKKHFPGF